MGRAHKTQKWFCALSLLSLSLIHILPSEFCQHYGLSGEVQGVLTLTCREILGHLASSASKDWTLEIPFTATFPES